MFSAGPSIDPQTKVLSKEVRKSAAVVLIKTQEKHLK